MTSARPFVALLGKELRAQFVQPIAWVLLAVYLLVMGYAFVTNLALTQSASLVRLMFQAAVLELLLIPLLTMRVLAEERRHGTLELLLATPAREADVVLAKYVACLLLLAVMLAPTLLQVAEIVGNRLAAVRAEIDHKLSASQGASASMIVAGQCRGGALRLFLIYPEGNFIEATEDTPFLQIGEHKYGKPILDRVVRPDTSLADAQKAVLLSMDSTLRSNLSVGMPLDLAVIRKDDCRVSHKRRILEGDPAFMAMSAAWSAALRDSFVKVTI